MRFSVWYLGRMQYYMFQLITAFPRLLSIKSANHPMYEYYFYPIQPHAWRVMLPHYIFVTLSLQSPLSPFKKSLPRSQGLICMTSYQRGAVRNAACLFVGGLWWILIARNVMPCLGVRYEKRYQERGLSITYGAVIKKLKTLQEEIATRWCSEYGYVGA